MPQRPSEAGGDCDPPPVTARGRPCPGNALTVSRADVLCRRGCARPPGGALLGGMAVPTRAKQRGARPAGEVLPPWPLPHFAGLPVTSGSPGTAVLGSLQTERAGGGGALRQGPAHACSLLQAGPVWGLGASHPGSSPLPGGKLELREGRLRVPRGECGSQRDLGTVTGSQQEHCSGLCNNQRLWPRLRCEPAGALQAQCPRQPLDSGWQLWARSWGALGTSPGLRYLLWTCPAVSWRLWLGYRTAAGRRPPWASAGLPDTRQAHSSVRSLLVPGPPPDASLTETLSLLQGPAEVQPSINSMKPYPVTATATDFLGPRRRVPPSPPGETPIHSLKPSPQQAALGRLSPSFLNGDRCDSPGFL